MLLDVSSPGLPCPTSLGYDTAAMMKLQLPTPAHHNHPSELPPSPLNSLHQASASGSPLSPGSGIYPADLSGYGPLYPGYCKQSRSSPYTTYSSPYTRYGYGNYGGAGVPHPTPAQLQHLPR